VEPDQQVDSVAMAVPDLEQCRDRVVDIASPERRLVAFLHEGLSQGLRLALSDAGSPPAGAGARGQEGAHRSG